jgi:nucleotide-binding universal stress UspA family protein
MRTILAAVDGSTRAKGVLAQAVALASAQGAQLDLVRAVGLPADVPQDFWKTTDESLLEVLQHRARDYLAQCVADVPPDRRGSTHVVVGVPWQAISATAEAIRADLVVLGSHGYSGADRLLGTTAAKVVNHSPCSVLVVKEPTPAKDVP